MDKRTFLAELRKSLRILKEEELQDIISEYEQHIDMKVSRGLTEEDAIADFGSLDELKSEILAAYHVRADYEVEQQGRILVGAEDPENTEKSDKKHMDTAFGGKEAGSAGETSGQRKRAAFGVRVKDDWSRSKEWMVRCWRKLCGLAVWTWKKARSLTSWIWRKLKALGIWCWKGLCRIAGWIVAVFPWMRPGWHDAEPTSPLKYEASEAGAVEAGATTDGTFNSKASTDGVSEVLDEENIVSEKMEAKEASTEKDQVKKQEMRQEKMERKKNVTEVSEKRQKKSGGILSLPGRMLASLWRAVVGIWNWSLAAAWWCVKVCWNIWWIGWALVLGGIGLIVLFCLGVLAVLLMQGYPLAGLAIGCLGATLGLFSSAAFVCTLLCRIRKREETVLVYEASKIALPEKTALPDTSMNVEVSQNA